MEEVGLYRRWYVAELANFLGIADLRGPFSQSSLHLSLSLLFQTLYLPFTGRAWIKGNTTVTVHVRYEVDQWSVGMSFESRLNKSLNLISLTKVFYK